MLYCIQRPKGSARMPFDSMQAQMSVRAEAGTGSRS